MRAYFKVEYVYDVPQNGNQEHGPLLETNIGLFGKIGDEKKSRLLTDDEARAAGKMPKKRDGADPFIGAFDIALNMLLEDKKRELNPPKQVPVKKYNAQTKKMEELFHEGKRVVKDETYHKQWNTTRFTELCMDRLGWSVSESESFLHTQQVHLLTELQNTLDALSLKTKIEVRPMSEEVPAHYKRVRTKKSRKSLMRELAVTRLHRKGLL